MNIQVKVLGQWISDQQAKISDPLTYEEFCKEFYKTASFIDRILVKPDRYWYSFTLPRKLTNIENETYYYITKEFYDYLREL